VQPTSGDYLADCSDCDDGDAGVGGPADCRFPTSWLLSDVGAGPDAELQGSGAAEVGWTLAAANLDGNDYDDLLVGYLDNGVGKLALVWGTPGRRTGPVLLSNAADLTLPVDVDATEEYGTAIQVFPDVNDDDMREILVGDPSATQAGTLAAGAVYAYLSTTGDEYALQARFVGGAAGDRAGERMAFLPWFHGPNYYIATSAPGANLGSGAVYIVGGIGTASEDVALSDVGSLISSVPENAIEFGAGMASVGLADYWPALVVGARFLPGEPIDPRGGIFLFRGDPTGSTDYSFLNSAEVKIGGEEDSDGHFGSMIANAGDVNDDGYDDLLVGAPEFSSQGHTENGKVYLLSGDLDGGEFSLDTLGASKRIASFDGAHSGAHAGGPCTCSTAARTSPGPTT